MFVEYLESHSEGELKALIAQGADINARDFRDTTPLLRVVTPSFYSFDSGSALAKVKVLLEYGADPNLPDCNGNTPLHLVSHADIAHELIEHGVDVNARNLSGETPLLRVVTPGFYSFDSGSALAKVKALLQHGADPNLADCNGNTPLHWVSHVAVAHELIEHGADINAQNHAGETALHVAVQRHGWQSDVELKVRFLLDHKADLSITDKQGQTPSDIATQNMDLTMVGMLGAARREREALATPPERSRSRERGRS